VEVEDEVEAAVDFFSILFFLFIFGIWRNESGYFFPFRFDLLSPALVWLG
jgi:hypothetical protein